MRRFHSLILLRLSGSREVLVDAEAPKFGRILGERVTLWEGPQLQTWRHPYGRVTGVRNTHPVETHY